MEAKIQARVKPEFKKKVRAAAAKSPFKTLEEWIIHAVGNQLRTDGFDPGDLGPLADLSDEDRERAERFIKFLREAPEGLKEASDLAQRVLKKALDELRRSDREKL